MTNVIDVLRAHQSKEQSKWREQAQWHVDNWGWLKHSFKIAITAKSRMNSLGLTQKDLAARMGCSQQYVSLILKGKENLTLETISRLEKALDCDLLVSAEQIGQYLSDSDGKDADPNIKTSGLVDGYK